MTYRKLLLLVGSGVLAVGVIAILNGITPLVALVLLPAGWFIYGRFVLRPVTRYFYLEMVSDKELAVHLRVEKIRGNYVPAKDFRLFLQKVSEMRRNGVLRQKRLRVTSLLIRPEYARKLGLDPVERGLFLRLLYCASYFIRYKGRLDRWADTKRKFRNGLYTVIIDLDGRLLR
ncbi:hypothetical protein CTH_10003 (plasmid) [Carboxydocella thermautotrophica]|nr:hypothetical protein CTH_10003 [Carboxydocella thermautotrophica]